MKRSLKSDQENGDSSSHRENGALWSVNFGVIILLTVLTWLSYSNTLEVPFLFDDHQNITKNPSIQINDLSWASLRTTTSENPTPRPLAYLTFAFNYFAHGMDVKGFHIVNITIHLINGYLVYFLARKVFALDPQQQITGDASRKITLAAIFTAAVFVTHPIQISSVTYIVQRMASLSALFLCFWMVFHTPIAIDVPSHAPKY